jgi:hypothetical protein
VCLCVCVSVCLCVCVRACVRARVQGTGKISAKNEARALRWCAWLLDQVCIHAGCRGARAGSLRCEHGRHRWQRGESVGGVRLRDMVGKRRGGIAQVYSQTFGAEHAQPPAEDSGDEWRVQRRWAAQIASGEPLPQPCRTPCICRRALTTIRPIRHSHCTVWNHVRGVTGAVGSR